MTEQDDKVNIDLAASYVIFGRDLAKLPPAGFALIHEDIRKVIQHLVWTEVDIDDAISSINDEDEDDKLNLTETEREAVISIVQGSELLFDDATIGRVNDDLFQAVRDAITEVREERETEAINGDQ